jgi:heat shock protein HslJ
MRHLIAPIATLALVASFTVPATATTSPLEGANYVLVSLAGDPAGLTTVLAPGSTTPTLTLAEGKARGTDGCNTYITSATADAEGHIAVDAARSISTMKACPEPVMQRAQAFKDALSSATRYTTDAGSLTLLDMTGTTVAVFAKVDTTLADTVWEVTGYNNGKQAVVSVITGSTLTAEFRADGRLTGLAGCNRYMATYQVDGSKIEITTPAATRRNCPEPKGVMEQEAQFLAALATAATFRIDGDRLELRTQKGSLAVSLHRAGVFLPRTRE